MTRPGTEIISRAQPLPRSAPTDTGVWFVAGQTVSGTALTPTLITSLTQYENVFGARSGVGVALWDAVETYFREGGAKVYVCKAATASEADAIAALAKFDKALGPGQVSLPGLFTTTAHTALLDHAALTNRVAILDGNPTGTAAQQQTLATALKALANARYGGLWAPAAIVPGVAGGTVRQVPFSAIQAGLIGRSDAIYTANVPAAGSNGVSNFATDLAVRYTDAEYASLNQGGVNCAKLVYGVVQSYGYRTVVDPTGPANAWLNFSNARLNMEITSGAGNVAERYVFSQLDGRRQKISQFGAELRALLLPYFAEGALHGETPDEAFDVNVGAQVNTPQTIANGELHAVLQVRMSPFAEWVVIEIVKVATTEALAA